MSENTMRATTHPQPSPPSTRRLYAEITPMLWGKWRIILTDRVTVDDSW